MKILKKVALFLSIPVLYVFLTLSTLFRSRRYRGELKSKVWYEFYPEGLIDSRGRPSPFYFRKGIGNKLLVFLCGGGVSWSEESAARPMSIPSMMLGTTTYYTPKVYRFMRVFFTGILADKPENPFRDWNVIYIPYVTGDFHLGDNEFPYTDRKGRHRLIHHKGEGNTRIIMDMCRELFPEQETVLVCGDSAGAFGAVGNAPIVAEYYPDVPVTVYSDASQIIVPLWRRTAGQVWRVREKMLAKMEEEGDLYHDLIQYASAEIGKRAVFLRSNTLYDDVLIQFGSTLQGGAHEATPEAMQYYFESLRRTEKRLAESPLPYYAFVTSHNKNEKTGLTQHTMARSEKSFYHKDDVGISLCQWLLDAVDGTCRSVGCDALE